MILYNIRLLLLILFLLIPVAGYSADEVDHHTYIFYTGENLTIAWDPPSADVTYTALQVHHYEQDQTITPIAIASVPQPQNQVTFSIGRGGHWIILARHCKPGDPDVCSEVSMSTDPSYSTVDGEPRGWWVYTFIAPPTGGVIENRGWQLTN